MSAPDSLTFCAPPACPFDPGAVLAHTFTTKARRRRKERFSLGPVFGAGLVAFLLWLGWNVFIHSDAPPVYMLVALAGTAGVVQMVSPWTPPPPPHFMNKID